MTPDSKKTYVASLLDSIITVIDTQAKTVVGTITLLANYNAVTGVVSPDPVSGVTFVGALPIQTPVSPDGKSMVTANTLTGTITIVNPVTDKVVAMLGCDPGCHGVQYGAKQGGGYYAYVSSKFSNSLIIVDPDPNNHAIQLMQPLPAGFCLRRSVQRQPTMLLPAIAVWVVRAS